ncbi:ribosylpyrimidine nucleosidase [Paenibacillus baekrokdamisoli]|uniref:Ribosylpyrimidine nucleosidase n=1 Tax=Paenibacillus baekrokdamisoli TaxID=1712516 RepID=A0A3G9J1G7_9BACL|nr:nucleoside hydrolase [Paenibacillus baekrokdamisoli]MBB3069395.1 purine nucleosidase/pyrimidine-specific ribonucleoside hydrolase [Paenibacillus baekrokdamisoli]BBH25030.1 ribosylpyrimidine nucleosidase [Paenibacillus baekrokdamisoli]BBH25048.1 ribosylpyrimidine nucleosidase [Paenibacillus baekrokdamisoli]
MKRVIIDTDIGGDIDDVLAIALAIHSPEIQIEGITTVGVQSDRRAKIASGLLQVNNAAHIPVAAGASVPLCGKWNYEEFPNQYGEEMDAFSYRSDLDGADLMIQAVNESPGQITIVAIGAMTNLAIAISRSPEFSRNVKEVILMGGEYSSHYKECNIVSDPEAANILFSSGIPIIAAGLEVCLSLTSDTDATIDTLIRTDTVQSQFLARLVKRWKAVGVNRPIIMFDAIPFAILINRSIVCTESKLVHVETRGEHTRGMTYSMKPHFGEIPESKPNVQVCMDVNHEELMELFTTRTLLT